MMWGADVLEDLVAIGDPRDRVLIADDDAVFRALLVTLVRSTSNVSVLVAADGIEALQLGLQFRPRVVVLDLNMPRLDGVEVAMTLRDMQPSIPIALQSSDPVDLHARAGGLGIRLFDKLDSRGMVAWTEKQIRSWSAHATRSPDGKSSTDDRAHARVLPPVCGPC
jgi:CheY-like chemotaxis protein